MRIEKLLIPAFGPFTGREFDFTPGHGKLEILYGLNEAGKSSLLRAIYALLYGVPGQTPDDFLHPYKSLRIGATLEHEGARLSFFRRKANKDSLLKADNLSVLPDQDLRAFVPIPEESFATMFGLDAERLAEGGKELLEGGGEYGALLFGAATGIVALRQIQQQLDAGADRLFRPSTAKSVIRGILAARDDARKRIRETSFTALNLKDLLERREAASSAQRGLDDSLRALSTEVARLERLRMIHPLLDSRRNCLAALSGLGEALLLREAFASEFEEFRRRGQAAAAERSGLEARIASLQASLSRLQFSTPLIDGKDRIAGLHQLLGAHLKAQQDLPKLRAALALLQQQMSGLLRKLGASPELEAAAALRVLEHDALLAGELIEEAAVRSANLSQALQDESNHAAGCDSARRELQDLPEDIPDHALRDACQAALALTEIERLVPARLQKLAAAQANLGKDLAALPWPGDIASLSRAALPAVAAVHAWKTRLADAAAAVKSMRQAVLDASREVEVCGAALSRGKAVRPLPSLDDLHASRDRRQSQWSLIRRAWLGEPPAAAERAQSGPTASDPPALAGAYEGAVEMADRIADELREHADEVAQLAQAQADLHSAQSRLQARQAELAEAASGEQRLLSEWASLWAPHAVDAGSPEQMLAWIERRGRLLGEDAALSADQRSIDLDVARLEQARKDLLEALRPFAVEPLPRDVSFHSLRRMAESRLAELSRVRQMWSVIQDRLAQSEQNLAQARLKLDALRHQESEWRGKWAALLARIHLHPPVEPPALKVILALRNDLSQRQDEAAGLGARIASIERDAHAFERDVRGLCGLLSPDLQDHDPPAALALLQERLQSALETRKLHQDYARQAAEAEQRLAALAVEDAALAALGAALAAEACCDSLAGIPARIQASQQLRDFRTKLRELEDQLSSMSAGATLEELERQAAEQSADLIPGRIQELRRESEAKSDARDRALQDAAQADAELAKLSAASEAADARAEFEAQGADFLEAAGQYLRIAFAAHILRVSVERHSGQSAAPLLARSSSIFADLTRGSYQGLHPEVVNDKPVLVGVRPDRSTVFPDGMSDGTRDQLYLALRVASLEQFFDHHPPVPVILDDLLVHFDDDRAASALAVLANLARKTQVLLLTHHRHLVDLARNTLPSGSFALYPLAAAAHAGRPPLSSDPFAPPPAAK